MKKHVKLQKINKEILIFFNLLDNYLLTPEIKNYAIMHKTA